MHAFAHTVLCSHCAVLTLLCSHCAVLRSPPLRLQTLLSTPQVLVVKAGRIPVGVITDKLGELGRGSFGVVIKAKTTCANGLPAVVAIKQMQCAAHSGEASTAAADIDDEAAVIAGLPSHPNVVRLYGWGDIFGKPSLVFELCEEGDLHSYLKRNTHAGGRSVTPATVLDLSRQIAAGMAHIHANRMYVTPSLFVNGGDGGWWRCWVGGGCEILGVLSVCVCVCVCVRVRACV
jgi:hypothetical protein